jgi:hypothetical protein
MAARVTKRDVEALVAEIHLYLETVDTFRGLGLEPRWRAEGKPARRTKRGSPKSREGG